jgi:hypothetical protein
MGGSLAAGTGKRTAEAGLTQAVTPREADDLVGTHNFWMSSWLPLEEWIGRTDVPDGFAHLHVASGSRCVTAPRPADMRRR